MALLVSQDTYTRTIKDKEDGATYEVTYRYLSGYEAKRVMSMRMSEDGANFDMGAPMVAAVEHAVTKWTLPFEATRDNIERLTTPILEQLYLYVSLDGVEPPQEDGDEDLPLDSSPSATGSGERSEASD